MSPERRRTFGARPHKKSHRELARENADLARRMNSFVRVLAALCFERGGEFRVDAALLRRVTKHHIIKAESDPATGEVVVTVRDEAPLTSSI